MSRRGVAGARVAVVGLGASGRAAADVVATLGGRVSGFDRAAEAVAAAAAEVPTASFSAHPDGDGLAAAALAVRPDVVVVSPGIPSHAPVFAAARAAGVPVWSEVELAWQVQAPRPDDAQLLRRVLI
ncbi:MAG: UDP-N-acetylmuramoyl-L-alanine--D-glutamate ligase, partial [Actinomycetota bacterium]